MKWQRNRELLVGWKGERGRRQRNRTEGGGRGRASYSEDGKINVKKRQIKIEMGKTGERNRELLLVLEG